jgi:hypothetical protein
MKRQTFFFVVLAVLAFAGNGFSQSGGIIDSVVDVIAKNGIFTIGGSGKEPFTQQACALPEVFNFLDSAGAREPSAPGSKSTACFRTGACKPPANA